MYAEIKGVWVGDRTNADGKYLILNTEGNEFIVTDGEGIYKTGEHIISNKLTTTIGKLASTEIKNITINDEDPIPKLEELKLAYPSPLRPPYQAQGCFIRYNRGRKMSRKRKKENNRNESN